MGDLEAGVNEDTLSVFANFVCDVYRHPTVLRVVGLTKLGFGSVMSLVQDSGLHDEEDLDYGGITTARTIKTDRGEKDRREEGQKKDDINGETVRNTRTRTQTTPDSEESEVWKTFRCKGVNIQDFLQVFQG